MLTKITQPALECGVLNEGQFNFLSEIIRISLIVKQDYKSFKIMHSITTITNAMVTR